MATGVLSASVIVASIFIANMYGIRSVAFTVLNVNPYPLAGVIGLGITSELLRGQRAPLILKRESLLSPSLSQPLQHFNWSYFSFGAISRCLSFVYLGQ